MSPAGEPAGSHTDYSSYLLIDDLLRLQRPLSTGADDEMLFIVVHQAYELWFKLVLHELDCATARLQAGRVWGATARLERAVAVEELLLAQLKVLETMSPDAFFAFRDPLAPASGFQSIQFREIELVSGGLTPSAGAVASFDEEAQARLSARANGPTLWDATVSCMTTCGLLEGPADPLAPGSPLVPGSPPAAGEEEVLSVLAGIYQEHDEPLRAWFLDLFERLVDHDEVLARWRYHHSLTAAREIGRRPGTGGSRGVEYLAGTLERRCFPLLWEVRSRL